LVRDLLFCEKSFAVLPSGMILTPGAHNIVRSKKVESDLNTYLNLHRLSIFHGWLEAARNPEAVYGIIRSQRDRKRG
jgi:hypothetical protein